MGVEYSVVEYKGCFVYQCTNTRKAFCVSLH